MNFSADRAIMEEGSEWGENLTHQGKYGWLMFASC